MFQPYRCYLLICAEHPNSVDLRNEVAARLGPARVQNGGGAKRLPSRPQNRRTTVWANKRMKYGAIVAGAALAVSLAVPESTAAAQPGTRPRNIPAHAGELRVAPKTGIRFRYIPAGTFLMGSPENELGRDDDETRHTVALTGGYWIGETEVTQAQWNRVMGRNPSHHSDCGDDCPVEMVSWFDIVRFVNILSLLEGVPECYEVDGERVTFRGLDCRGFRLPTEAEWENAARAKTTTPYYFGSDVSELVDHAWLSDNSRMSPHPVSQKKPNPWGLFDIYGNVWEWCHDSYEAYPEQAQDPLGPETGSYRVLRGGSFDFSRDFLRGAARYYIGPEFESSYFGFRVAYGDRALRSSGLSHRPSRHRRDAEPGGKV